VHELLLNPTEAEDRSILTGTGRSLTMQCPRCSQRLRTTTSGGVHIEECPDCNGLWLAEDELRRLKDAVDPDLSWMDFELWQHPDRFHVTPAPVECPSCGRQIAAIDYGNTTIEVDYCTHCRGVWLDSGELDKIVHALTEELLTKDVSRYVRASIDEAREIIAGPESLLSEWRDFLTVLRMLEYRILSENPRLGKILANLQASDPFR
jgi:Zn-finger nucleic acid-binding protein